ncbi:hypothetical protein L3V31_00205 [Vibrio sp. J1-1]|nr:hypothetical protein [Vibrio sp. J1-1]MCF7480157.1 hypothetical protein [Vibrio sp. J1-1]
MSTPFKAIAVVMLAVTINYLTRNSGHFIAVGNEVSGTTSVYRIEL